MHAARFDVLVHGFRAGGGVHPAAALQLALKLDSRTARILVERFPCVVLSAVPHDHAERARGELTRYGAQVELRQSKLGRRSSDERGVASEPEVSGPGDTDYELGEILAPLGRAAAPAAKPAARSPLRSISLLPDDPAAVVKPARPAIASNDPPAFGGFFDEDAPIQLAIELPARSFGGARAGVVVGELPKPPPRERLRKRLRRWTARGFSFIGPMVFHGVLFIVVTVVTLAAVSWAMRTPRSTHDALSPFGDGSILGE